MSITGIKKKKVSKKTKSSWRKHSDINDIEEFLQEQRQEERIGEFADKPDDELFAIDVRSDKKSQLSEKQKRKLNALKPPKYLTALENTSKVKDPLAKRNSVKLRKNGRNLEDEVLNPKKPRDFQANKDRMKQYNKVSKAISDNKFKVNQVFKNDLWEEKDAREKLQEFNSEPISRELALHHLKNTGRPLVKIHDTTHHKTSRIKAFENLHPGMSYNPSLKDHQDLMEKVIEKEGKIIKKEKHLKRVTTNMFSKVSAFERDSEILKELVSGLPVEDGGIAENFENEGKDETHVRDNDDNISSVNPPVQNKKKAKKARRKEKEQKQISRTLQEKKNMKKQVTDIHRLQHIKKDVILEEETTNALKKRRKLIYRQKKFEPKRLSKVKFEDLDIDINNVEDISGNLRNVKPESSLLVDRFKNFQKRSILPASVDVGIRKRRKIKRFTSSSHKEVQLPLGKNNKKT